MKMSRHMKGKFIITLFIALLIVFGISTSSEATLIDRGGGLIYDTDLDITLMQEINSSWLLNAPGSWSTGNGSGGVMSWPDAKIWEESGISYYSSEHNKLITGWRMLSITDSVMLGGDGINICTGYNCILSEFGHIWYTDLGNTAGSLTNMGPFTLTGSIGAIWGSESWGDWPEDPFPYPFAHFIWSGSGGYQGWGDCHIVWLAVDGDVVPEPATLILLGAGVLGLAGLRKKRS